MGGGIAIIESNIISSISLLERPGIPLDADVSLLVLSYLIAGYILKDKTVDLFQRKSLKLDIIAVGVAAVLILEHLLMERYGIPRKIDMKLVVYTNPISVYIIPALYGLVIARLSHRRSGGDMEQISICTRCGQTSNQTVLEHIRNCGEYPCR